MSSMAVDNRNHALIGGVLVGLGYFLQGRKGFKAEHQFPPIVSHRNFAYRLRTDVTPENWGSDDKIAWYCPIYATYNSPNDLGRCVQFILSEIHMTPEDWKQQGWYEDEIEDKLITPHQDESNIFIYGGSESFASDMEVGKTIYQQLGGNRFRMMTGAKEMYWDGDTNSLQMKLGRNSLGANYLVITLNNRDLYDMRFESRRWNRKTYDLNVKVKAEYNDLYADQLQSVFTEATGLYTRMAESFSQWSQDEMNEPSHKGSKMQFDDWLDDEIKSHGDIPLSEWGYEEEHDEPEHQHAESFNAEMVDVENHLIEIPCVIDGQDAILTNFGYGVHGDELGRLHFYFSDGDFVFEDDMLESQGDTWEEKMKRLNKDMDRIFKENNIPPHKGVGVDESRIDLRRVIEEWGISELEWDEEKGDLMLTLELNDGVDKQYAYISTPLKRDDFVNHNNAETFDAESFNAENRPPSYMADADAHKLMEGAWRINSFVESEEEYPEWWKSRLSVVASTVDDLADYLDYSESEDFETETFSAEAEGGILYSKNEMPAGKRHYVWSLDSDEAGRYQVRIVGSDMPPAIPMKYFERAWEGTGPNNFNNPSHNSFAEPKEGKYSPHLLDFRYPKYMRKSNDPLKKGLKHQISIDANEWDWERFSRENPKLLRKLYNKDGQFFYVFANFDPSHWMHHSQRKQRYRRA